MCDAYFDASFTGESALRVPTFPSLSQLGPFCIGYICGPSGTVRALKPLDVCGWGWGWGRGSDLGNVSLTLCCSNSADQSSGPSLCRCRAKA